MQNRKNVTCSFQFLKASFQTIGRVKDGCCVNENRQKWPLTLRKSGTGRSQQAASPRQMLLWATLAVACL